MLEGMVPDQAAEKPSWHLGHLDALRGIAVLGVLMVHSRVDCALSRRWFELASNGQRGVQLFFLVSAFTLFLSNDQRRRKEAHPVRNFFIRRFFRLTPMYYTAILITAFVLPGMLSDWRIALAGLTYGQWLYPPAVFGVAPGAWTMSIEATFYLTLPLLFRWIRSMYGAVWALVLGMGIFGGASLGLLHFYPGQIEYLTLFWFPYEFPVFLMGIVLYFFWKDWVVAGRLWAAGQTRAVSALFLAGFVFLLLSSLPRRNETLYLSSAGYGCLLLSVSLFPWPLLVNRATIFLGRISYSVYLLHGFVLEAVERMAERSRFLCVHATDRFLFQWAATLVLSAAAGTVTWWLIEENGIRLGRTLIARLEHRASPGPQTGIPGTAVVLLQEPNTPDAQF